jgi:hypothetical protein
MNLTTPTSKLAIQAAVVGGGPCEAETVQHILKQGGKAGTVQPVAAEPPVSTKDNVGVVVICQKTGEMAQHFIHRTETSTKLNINLNDQKINPNSHFRQILFQTDNNFRNPN